MRSPLIARSRDHDHANGDDSWLETKVPSRRSLDWQQRVLVALEGLVSISALGGGAYMTSHPLTAMPLKYLQGTWFDSWRWPGVALIFFVGVCPALTVTSVFLRHRFEMAGHFAVGVGLVAWILIEALWVVVSPDLQITIGTIGVMIIVLAISERHRRIGGRNVEV